MRNILKSKNIRKRQNTHFAHKKIRTIHKNKLYIRQKTTGAKENWSAEKIHVNKYSEPKSNKKFREETKDLIGDDFENIMTTRTGATMNDYTKIYGLKNNIRIKMYHTFDKVEPVYKNSVIIGYKYFNLRNKKVDKPKEWIR